MQLDDLLVRACTRRVEALSPSPTDALRVFHGPADGIDGLVIERFADVLIAQTFPGRAVPDEAELACAVELLRQHLGARAVYRKVFVTDRACASPEVARMHAIAQPWLGDAVEPSVPVTEHGLRFLVHPYDGFSVGLFLEHRDNRERIRRLAKGLRVLNLFSYTCSFSVAAAAGGAASVSSVDLSRRYLEWGRQNFQANNIDLANHLFFCSDTLDFYARAKRQGRRYDLIVLDPPTFGRTRRPRRTFVLEEQLADLLQGAVDLLEPGGSLLFSTNARPIRVDRIERDLCRAAGRRECSIVERPPLPADFCGDKDYSKTVLARFG